MEILSGWWLESNNCKCMLACFVHKDYKDLSSKPTKLPPDKSRKDARKDKQRANKEERAVAKLDHPVAENSRERYGDVDHQIKKAKVQGIQSSAEKIAVDSIIAQINVTRENKDEYILIYGEEKYKNIIANLLCQLPGHQSSSGLSAGDGRAVSTRVVEDLTHVQSDNKNDSDKKMDDSE